MGLEGDHETALADDITGRPQHGLDLGGVVGLPLIHISEPTRPY